MTDKLTYEEWRKTYTVTLTQEAKDDIRNFFNLDLESEIENMRLYEYGLYLNKDDITDKSGNNANY